MGEKVVRVENFIKKYDNFTAVKGISFDVFKGEIFGLLGPNGAGKTSTLECLEGLRKIDGGKMEIMGINPENGGKLRNIIGVQLQSSGLPDFIRANEAMKLFCSYHGIEPRIDLLKRMGLGDKLRTEYGRLSMGQQRRLVLALAVAHNPAVLILDEPTAALDVASRTELHDVMRELKESGTAILLASHDMAEVEKMADRIAIMLNGRIVAEGTPREITASGGGLTKISVRVAGNSLKIRTENFSGMKQRLQMEEYEIYFTTDPGRAVSEIIGYINIAGDELIDLRVERPSLEERFLEITNTGGAV